MLQTYAQHGGKCYDILCELLSVFGVTVLSLSLSLSLCVCIIVIVIVIDIVS